jgi:hypothetical protein
MHDLQRCKHYVAGISHAALDSAAQQVQAQPDVQRMPAVATIGLQSYAADPTCNIVC